MTPTPNVTGLVLAGGAGSRVRHQDKGLLNWRGKALVAHVCSRLEPQVESLIISCNRNLSQYREFATTVLPDLRKGYQGPLAGLESASKHLQTEYLAVVSCDTPLIPPDFVLRLVEPLLAPSSVDISYVHDGHRDQYLCAVIKQSCLETLEAYLDAQNRSVRGWYETKTSIAVDFADCALSFRNYNTLTELKE